MIDNHYYPQNFLHWGIKPTLFYIGDFGILSYSFFVLLGLLVGILIYFHESKRQKSLDEKGIFIAIGALAGGALGAKILQWIIHYKYIFSHISNLDVFLSGRTIVGGLIGGTIGSILTKKALKIKEKRGNLFAPAAAMGIAIGRLGCFFRGCCYGKETFLPWGVNFGDGVLRHPTQIYESLFMLIMFLYLEKIKNKKDVKPGQLFKLLLISYFIFRFFEEFIKVEPVVFSGLTVFQIISIGAIIYLTRDNIINLIFKLKKYGKQQQE
ncbi:MAG: prolipoprotein diacylglyceryl transferase family protein [Patescibacteria group bacterium]|jgi:phosphatidylglycerol:prolipoprotein diacylglycerol transferase